MKAKHPTGANLDDSLITSGGGTNAEASQQQTSLIQPGLVDQSAEGDYPVFNAHTDYSLISVPSQGSYNSTIWMGGSH